MVVAQVLPLLLLKSILILDIVIKIRDDEDGGEDDGEDGGEDAELITAHSYCNTILHHLIIILI